MIWTDKLYIKNSQNIMGIKKLNTFLLNNKSVSIHSSLSEFKQYYTAQPTNTSSDNKLLHICIDTNLYMYKYLYSWGNFKYSFLNQIMMFLSHGIVPVYVFDGKSPKEKSLTLLMRRSKKSKLLDKIHYYKSLEPTQETRNILNNLYRKNISISPNDNKSFKYMLDILCIPYYQANGESDVMCAELCKRGVVDMCLSEDMDILTFGCPRLVKIIKGKVYFYSLPTILDNLSIEYNQFVEFCALLGCDYCKPIRTKNVHELLSTLKSSSLDHTLCQYNILDTSSYTTAINMFSNAHLDETITSMPVFYFSKLNPNDIIDFMVENNFYNWQITRINSLVALIKC